MTEPTDDLQRRCAECIEWQQTGELRQGALREYAAKHWQGHSDSLQMAERAAECRAMEVVARWGTPPAVAGEPVAWQSRTRPTWGANTSPWSPWEPCTKGQAEDYWKTPLLHDWAYEARALYTAPQAAPAAQGDAEDAARWRDWAAAVVEASANGDGDTPFMKAFSDAIGDSEAPFTTEQFAAWVDAARKQGGA